MLKMIARIIGILEELDTDSNVALVEVGQLGYEVMVPGYAVSDLSARVGREVVLYCLEYYEASGGIGGNLIPRIIGFPQAQDKQFFQRFIKVKGIGVRKALRALSRPIGEIAVEIETGDTKMLATLPEIGKRTAEQIVAELKGKVELFALSGKHLVAEHKPLSDAAREALVILLQLGEKEVEAEALIQQVLEDKPEITTDALVQAVYRLKG
ncbi:MAG: hypothetical protein JW936_09415 [Sedimentisphaerales bacterium]|nr:hypothetical protein [Sedimentisphaerales bacterium]